MNITYLCSQAAFSIPKVNDGLVFLIHFMFYDSSLVFSKSFNISAKGLPMIFSICSSTSAPFLLPQSLSGGLLPPAPKLTGLWLNALLLVLGLCSHLSDGYPSPYVEDRSSPFIHMMLLTSRGEAYYSSYSPLPHLKASLGWLCDQI